MIRGVKFTQKAGCFVSAADLIPFFTNRFQHSLELNTVE